MELKDKLEIVEGNYEHYRSMQNYHYIKNKLISYRDIYIVRPKHAHANQLPPVLSFIVYSNPIINLKGRNKLIPDLYDKHPGKGDRLQWVNANISVLARLITDPRFRKRGLAKWLVAETLNQQKSNMVEVLTPIDFTNQMFMKAGFELTFNPAPDYYRRFTEKLIEVGISHKLFEFQRFVAMRIRRLTTAQEKMVMYEIDRFRSHFKRGRNADPLETKLKQVLAKFPYPQSYGLWRKNRGDTYKKVQT